MKYHQTLQTTCITLTLDIIALCHIRACSSDQCN